MDTFKCLIIEDEPIAARVLTRFIESVEALELVNVCHNALAGFDVLQQQTIDLLFLDIKMPQLDGLSFLRTLKQPPKVIITTAYSEYALESYELDIVDYLLKPIAEPRFMKAVLKATQRIVVPLSKIPAFDYSAPYIYLKSDKKMVKVFLQDILYIESLGNYVKVITHNKVVITYQTLQFFEQHLPTELFLRIHRSYIIALPKLEAFTAAYVELKTDVRLPIGQNYKTSTMTLLKK